MHPSVPASSRAFLEGMFCSYPELSSSVLGHLSPTALPIQPFWLPKVFVSVGLLVPSSPPSSIPSFTWPSSRSCTLWTFPGVPASVYALSQVSNEVSPPPHLGVLRFPCLFCFLLFCFVFPIHLGLKPGLVKFLSFLFIYFFIQ